MKTHLTRFPARLSDIARTAAHEIGHYLLNTSSHDQDLWNLMRAGGAPGASFGNSVLTMKQYGDFIPQAWVI